MKKKRKIILLSIFVLIIAVPMVNFVGSQNKQLTKTEKQQKSIEEKIDFTSYPILKTALDEKGNVGGKKFWSWYGYDERVRWCACFVSWCAGEMDYIDNGIIPKFSNCRKEGVPWFKDKGLWKDADYIPESADLIFFDFNEDEVPDHVGFVLLTEDNTIYTIEGNVGDICREKKYPADDARIYGYGTPEYPES